MIQLTKLSAVCLFTLAPLLASPHAFADTCASTSCPQGFVCEEVGQPCAMTPPCASGEQCSEPAPCEPEMVALCLPSPCTSDADCGEDLACVSFSETICDSTPPCSAGEDCTSPDSGAEDSCQELSESFCAPPFIAPCTQDSDCGEGFVCQPEEICSCSDSGSSDPASPADEAEPADESCDCELTGENYCELVEVSCTTDADCPEAWSCSSIGDTAVSCTVNQQGDTADCEPDQAPELFCLPPLWESWGASDGSYDEALDRAASGELAAQLPEETNSNKTSTESGGCAVASASPAAGLPLLLLGLALLARRRRARR